MSTLRVCRLCGCTDAAACWPTCWWVEPGLCSSCAAITGLDTPENRAIRQAQLEEADRRMRAAPRAAAAGL